MAENITSMGQCYFLTEVMSVPVGSIYITTVFTCVINSILAITATSANALILWIIVTEPDLHTPANVFLCCLAISDLVIGAITQPAYVVYKVAELVVSPRVSCVARVLHWVVGWICSGVSMMTITAIAVERYLTLHLHVRYPTIVTISRVIKVVVTFWVVCIAIIMCLFAIKSDRYWTFVPAPIMVLNLSITVTAYWKIFRILQRHRNQIRDQLQIQVMGVPQGENGQAGLNIKRYRRSAVTAMYVLGLLLLCYIPFFCAMVTRVIVGYKVSVKIAYECGATIVYMNSTLNPTLYWRRIPDIRRAILKFMKRTRCWGTSDRVAVEESVCRSVAFQSTTIDMNRPSIKQIDW